MVEYHDDKKHGFTQTTGDDEWLHVVGRQKWIVISHDKRFHNDSLAVQAVRQHGVGVFYFDGGTFPTWDKLRMFAQSYGRMRTIVSTVKPPYIYHVKHTNRVTPIKGGW